MDEMFQVTDQWGRVVRLTRRQWTTHILPKHPELTSYATVVADSVRQPTLVRYDRTHADREIFYRLSPCPIRGTAFL